jgi:hypothetical protein
VLETPGDLQGHQSLAHEVPHFRLRLEVLGPEGSEEPPMYLWWQHKVARKCAIFQWCPKRWIKQFQPGGSRESQRFSATEPGGTC